MKRAFLIALAIAGLLLGIVAWLPRKDESEQRQPEANAKAGRPQENAPCSRKPALVEQEATSEGTAVCRGINNDRDANVREAVVATSSKLGRNASSVIQALPDKDEGLPSDALGNLGPEAIPVLIRSLGEDTVGVSASQALAQIGLPAVPQLVDALKEEKTRLFAFSTLCEIGLPAVPALIEATRGDDLSVRWLADMALQHILKTK